MRRNVARRLVVPDGPAAVVRRLPPEAKRRVRAALDDIRRDPAIGVVLERELAGQRRAAVGRLRIVYRVAAGTIEIVAIGPRATIYTELEREVGRGPD